MESHIEISLSDLNLDRKELYRSMGYGDNIPEEDVCALCERLMAEAEKVTRLSFYYRVMDCDIQAESITVGGVDFEAGKIISGLLRRSSQAAMFVATAGREFQKWLDAISASDDPISLFVADAIGSTAVEAMGDYMELRMQEAIPNLKHTNRFSPGYCKWNIEEQRKLFALLGGLDDGVLGEPRCGVVLNDSCLMHPIKSISGVIGIGEDVLTKKYGCSICQRTDCYMRRVK